MKTTAMKQHVLELTLQSFKERLFAGTSGNLSEYDPEQGIVAITPSGISYDAMGADDIMVIDLDGKILEGIHKPSSEWRMHTAVYKNRSDIRAVVHTHSPYATGFAVAHRPIPAALIEMIAYLGGDVPVAEFRLPGTEELGIGALEVLENRKACLLENHGVLAIGATLEKAHMSALYAEDAAKICCKAEMAGGINCVPMRFQNAMRKKYGLKEE